MCILSWRISSESEATVGALCGDSGVMPKAVSPDAKMSIRHINPAGGCEALIRSIVSQIWGEVDMAVCNWGSDITVSMYSDICIAP